MQSIFFGGFTILIGPSRIIKFISSWEALFFNAKLCSNFRPKGRFIMCTAVTTIINKSLKLIWLRRRGALGSFQGLIVISYFESGSCEPLSISPSSLKMTDDKSVIPGSIL